MGPSSTPTRPPAVSLPLEVPARGRTQGLSSWSSVPACTPACAGLDEGSVFTLWRVCPERPLSLSWGGRRHLPSLPRPLGRLRSTCPGEHPTAPMQERQAVTAGAARDAPRPGTCTWFMQEDVVFRRRTRGGGSGQEDPWEVVFMPTPCPSASFLNVGTFPGRQVQTAPPPFPKSPSASPGDRGSVCWDLTAFLPQEPASSG